MALRLTKLGPGQKKERGPFESEQRKTHQPSLVIKNDNIAEESGGKLPRPDRGTDAEITDSPDSYGKPRVVLLPVAPKMVHVFWDVNAGPHGRLKQQNGEDPRQAEAILRFHEGPDLVDKGATDHAFFDVIIDPHRQNSYVHLLDPGQSYLVEIGFKTQNGQFFPAARSNVAEMPRVCPVSETDNRDTSIPVNPEKFFSGKKIDEEPLGDNLDNLIDAGKTKATKKVEKNPEIFKDKNRFDEGILAQSSDQAEILKRRAVIFKHLQRTMPSHAARTIQFPGLNALVEGGRCFDLTALSEKKFMAGISSW